MFSISHLYNSACSYDANPIRIRPISMSIVLHHYKKLRKLSMEMNQKQVKPPKELEEKTSN
jgi:hypothetical protein